MSVKISFDRAFSSNMVLQQAPSRATVHGSVELSAQNHLPQSARYPPTVQVKLHDAWQTTIWAGEATLTAATPQQLHRVSTNVTRWNWIIHLEPRANNLAYHSVVATATTINKLVSRAALRHVAFGDVWICAGQSNMALPLRNTYHRNESVQRISEGWYDNVRLACGESNH